jgi:Mrp family chromosome partitioning ATPase
MSRNFDLLAQIEMKSGSPDQATGSPVHHATMVSVPSKDSSIDRSDETLRLVQRIFLSANGSAPRQIVLCGVDEENGSSSICARAGLTLAANSSQPVCLVDANVRSPGLSSMFGIDGTAPLSGTSAPLREQCVKVGGNLWLAGSNILADNGHVLLPVNELKKRLAQLREVFGYMLIDAPATSVCGDAQLLGQVADAAILVIEANSTRRLTARNAKETFDAAGVRLLGTVLHNRSFPIPEKLYRRL